MSTAEIAGKLVAAMHSASNAQVVAVASRTLAKAEAWAKTHNVPRAYGSYDELLAADDIDIVYIPLPSALKKEWVIKAANAGKHILVEKPFGATVSDVKEMVAACEQNNVQFMDGTMWKHSDRTAEIRQALDDGKIGATQRVNAVFTFGAPNEEWLHGGNGRTDKKREPMGCFGDQGWYPVGAILWAFNYETPVRVQMHYTVLNRVDTIISCGGTIFYSDNRTGHFNCGVLESHRSFVEISGRTGRILINDQVGGQARTGDFGAYFGAFVGSRSYVFGDAMGLDTEVSVNPCDHTEREVEKLSSIVLGSGLEARWPSESVLQQQVMTALLQSSNQDGAMVTL